MIGISIGDGGFELICSERIGRRRHLDDEIVSGLEDFGKRYGMLLASANPAAGLLALGRDLYRFLDGDGGDLTALIEKAPRPLRFEIVAPTRRPDKSTLSLLRAPWELLANAQGFLAGDTALGFSPVRRLGRPEPPLQLDQYRLGLVFMAASPRGTRELDYEAEETAIMTAVGSSELDLLVEESGNPGELADRVVEVPAMQALHLSCHGHNAWLLDGKTERRPVLMLEDEAGAEQPTEAGALIEPLRTKPPRLVFLSACLTAVGGGERRPEWRGDKQPGGAPPVAVAQSLAEAMIDGGFPAVLGWDGSVADRAATAFAATLYDRLAGRQDLADAVAIARRGLLNAADEARRGDWHLARLWLGPQGGGSLVGGSKRRDMMPATHGEKEFLVKERRKVPVASHEMFVGRRRELQTALRALRGHDHAGVLLHGMGRLGKSSLAARIANRRRDLKLAVVFEHYGALDVLEALGLALEENPEARELVRNGVQRVRDDPSRLEETLIDLLRAASMQAGGAGTPVLLVIDDLERILEAHPFAGRHRLQAAFAPVLRAVLRAFDRTIDSRLMLTSRFPFALDELEERLHHLQLPPLSPAAQRKLEQRQRSAAAEAGLAGEALAAREELLARVPTIARGNPGLQDLIGRRLVLSKAVTLEHAERAFREMEAWLAQGSLPTDADVRQFLENLAIDSLIGLANEAGRNVLRGLTLFDLPVPEAVAGHLETDASGALQHLRDLGLVDVLEDLVDQRQPAVAVNALVAGRLEPLGDPERDSLAHVLARPLFQAWGGAARTEKWPLACDLQLTRLALVAQDGEVVAACAAYAVMAQQGPATEAAALGMAAVTLLEAQRQAVPLRLLSETAKAAAASGDGEAADAMLARGAAADAAKSETDPMAAGFLAFEQARRLLTRGDLDEAERLFAQAAQIAAAAGNEISATIARGRIADILQDRGDLDEALRIRREEQLPVYARLGNERSGAITMGKTADILARRGDLDEALRIRREEELPVYERLGDVHSRAVTMGQIADILQSRGELDEALRIHREEQLPVYERLGEVRERAVTMSKIADIHSSRGDLDEALRIHREQLPVFERLGEVRSSAITMGKIADILIHRGDLDEALRIRREEELPVYERLGDMHSRAVTMGQIADILQRRGELDEALRIRREEELPVYERLGNVRSRAVTMSKIAEVLSIRGDFDGARALRDEALDVYRHLGDADGIAATLWGLAKLDLTQRKLDAAVPRIVEAYDIVSRLGRAEGIAAIGMVYGQTLAANERRAEALVVLQRSAEMFRKLGREANARAAEDLIGELGLA